jgi:hypothetical protein
VRGVIAIVIAVLGGCTETNRSVLPPFVRDLRAAYGGIEMIQCQLVVTSTHQQNFGSRDTKREISVGQCWTQVVPTEPPPGEAPPVTHVAPPVPGGPR